MLGRVSLFVPASSPAMINSSLAFDVDTIIFDLEDAVTIGEKDAARNLLYEALNFLDFNSKTVVVRINSLTTGYWEKDVNCILKIPSVNAVMVPKATSNSIRIISNIINDFNSDMAIIPLIETAEAVEDIKDIIKTSEKVEGILFGAEDYTADMGIERTKEGKEIFYARARLANVIHAFGIEGIDTPFIDTNDIEGLKEDTLFGKKLGYTGKAAINPRQVDMIERIYTPEEDEIKYALKILQALKEAGNRGAFTVDGKMIDAPIIARARLTLQRAGIEVNSYE